MRWLATLAVVVVSALMWPTAALGVSLGDWASAEGYDPGDAMPDTVNASHSSIDSLDGIGDFDWAATTTLNLGNNQLSSIVPGSFSRLTNLTNLEYLILHNNQLSGKDQHNPASIEPGSFSGLTNLKSLELYNNQLLSIEAGTFSELTNLKDLWLNNNQISNIESGSFSGLTKLEWLFLYNNQLSSIEAGTFSGLANLEYLDLDNNQLSSIEAGTFSGLTNLEELLLGNNTPLTELNLSKAEFINTKLKLFDVADCVNIRSVTLKNAVIDQTSLAVLSDGGHQFKIGFGKLSTIKEVYITELDLSGIDFGNNITDLTPLYVEDGVKGRMDDVIDLWLVDTVKLPASDLDVLLDNLKTMQDTAIEGVLHMTRANYDDFNRDGDDMLATWNREPGHHVDFVMQGDFDSDGTCDGADFLAWQRGESPYPLSSSDLAEWQAGFGSIYSGDFDGDNDVDGADFLHWQLYDGSESDLDLWQATFGDVASPMTAASTGVPEPGSLSLLGIGLAGLVMQRWRSS